MMDLDRRMNSFSLFNGPFGIIVEGGLKLSIYTEKLVKRQ